MSFLAGIGDLLKQYSAGGATRQQSSSGTALRPGSTGGALFYARRGFGRSISLGTNRTFSANGRAAVRQWE